MKLSYQDFYGQHITVHNETDSGNIRIAVDTMEDMNAVAVTAQKDCTVHTDISLNYRQAKILNEFLTAMLEGIEE